MGPADPHTRWNWRRASPQQHRPRPGSGRRRSSRHRSARPGRPARLRCAGDEQVPQQPGEEKQGDWCAQRLECRPSHQEDERRQCVGRDAVHAWRGSMFAHGSKRRPPRIAAFGDRGEPRPDRRGPAVVIRDRLDRPMARRGGGGGPARHDRRGGCGPARVYRGRRGRDPAGRNTGLVGGSVPRAAQANLRSCSRRSACGTSSRWMPWPAKSRPARASRSPRCRLMRGRRVRLRRRPRRTGLGDAGRHGRHERWWPPRPAPRVDASAGCRDRGGAGRRQHRATPAGDDQGQHRLSPAVAAGRQRGDAGSHHPRPAPPRPLLERARWRCLPSASVEDAVSVAGELRRQLPSLQAAELFFDAGLELVLEHAGAARRSASATRRTCSSRWRQQPTRPMHWRMPSPRPTAGCGMP